MFMQPAPCEANGLLLGFAAMSSDLVITLLLAAVNISRMNQEV